jgi:hypothetical protein
MMEMLSIMIVAGIFMTGVMFGSAVTLIVFLSEAGKKGTWTDAIDKTIGIK